MKRSFLYREKCAGARKTITNRRRKIKGEIPGEISAVVTALYDPCSSMEKVQSKEILLAILNMFTA